MWNLQTKQKRKLRSLEAVWKGYKDSNIEMSVPIFDLRNGRLVWTFHPFGNMGPGNYATLFDLKSNRYLSADLVYSATVYVFWNRSATEVIGLDYFFDETQTHEAVLLNFDAKKERRVVLPRFPSGKQMPEQFLGQRWDGRGVTLDVISRIRSTLLTRSPW